MPRPTPYENSTQSAINHFWDVVQYRALSQGFASGFDPYNHNDQWPPCDADGLGLRAYMSAHETKEQQR